MKSPISEALRLLADALEAGEHEQAPAVVQERPRYFSRRTAPVEGRVFDRAARELPAFKPGRELLVKADDLYAWIERHAVNRPTPQTDGEADAPLDFDMFRRRAVAKGGR